MMALTTFITWDISPEIFRIGSFAIRWYGLLFALSFVLGYQIMSKIYADERRTQKDMESLTITMIVGTIVGARLGHCFFYDPAYYLANPLLILKVWEGGLASHGAALGIIIALWYYSHKRTKFTLIWLLDRVVIVVALAGFLIRLGNFFNSEILGRAADIPWAVVFTRVDDLPRHPAQLYEAFSYLLIFLFLFISYRKQGANIPKGKLLGWFLVLVFGARFIIEYFKEVQSAFEVGMPLDMGQILSIPFILAGVYFVLYSRRK